MAQRISGNYDIQTWDGWIADPNTWTFVSSTQFTISSSTDYTGQFPVGGKIKLTQTTVKYFYVTSSSFAANTTTVNITGGSDYSLANAAITLPFYSPMSSPAGFPQWFNYTETWTGFSANPSGGNIQFSVNGRVCTFSIQRATAGTSNATSTTITLPITAATLTGSPAQRGMVANTFDNGATVTSAGLYTIASAATTASLFKDAGNGWTASGSKNWQGVINYAI